MPSSVAAHLENGFRDLFKTTAKTFMGFFTLSLKGIARGYSFEVSTV